MEQRFFIKPKCVLVFNITFIKHIKKKSTYNWSRFGIRKHQSLAGNYFPIQHLFPGRSLYVKQKHTVAILDLYYPPIHCCGGVGKNHKLLNENKGVQSLPAKPQSIPRCAVPTSNTAPQCQHTPKCKGYRTAKHWLLTKHCPTNPSFNTLRVRARQLVFTRMEKSMHAIDLYHLVLTPPCQQVEVLPAEWSSDPVHRLPHPRCAFLLNGIFK